jgi:foldase protein PrsA
MVDTVRRTPKKIVRKTVTPVSKRVVSEYTMPTQSPKTLRLKRSYLITLLIIVVVALILYFGKSLIIAAVVNGQPVSRIAVIQELERQGGKQALDSIITKALIVQEASKKNITVTQKDIDNEMKSITANLEKQGQKLDQVLTLQGMTKNQLVEQIQLQKMIEKMIGPITVSDKQIDDYITANKASLPQNEDEKALRVTVKTQLQQQGLSTKAQSFLAELRKNAKITTLVSY